MLSEKIIEVKQDPAVDAPCGRCGELHAYLRGFPFPYSALQVCLRCHADLEREAFGDPLRTCDECGEAKADEDLFPRGRRLLCSGCWDDMDMVREALRLAQRAQRLLDAVEARKGRRAGR